MSSYTGLDVLVHTMPMTFCAPLSGLSRLSRLFCLLTLHCPFCRYVANAATSRIVTLHMESSTANSSTAGATGATGAGSQFVGDFFDAVSLFQLDFSSAVPVPCIDAPKLMFERVYIGLVIPCIGVWGAAVVLAPGLLTRKTLRAWKRLLLKEQQCVDDQRLGDALADAVAMWRSDNKKAAARAKAKERVAGRQSHSTGRAGCGGRVCPTATNSAGAVDFGTGMICLHNDDRAARLQSAGSPGKSSAPCPVSYADISVDGYVDGADTGTEVHASREGPLGGAGDPLDTGKAGMLHGQIAGILSWKATHAGYAQRCQRFPSKSRLSVSQTSILPCLRDTKLLDNLAAFYLNETSDASSADDTDDTSTDMEVHDQCAGYLPVPLHRHGRRRLSPEESSARMWEVVRGVERGAGAKAGADEWSSASDTEDDAATCQFHST